MDLMKREAGEHFEPKLVELLEANLGAILEIKERWKED
jgi:response regulator RpfG family c-di-GMP phosphodiesterase